MAELTLTTTEEGVYEREDQWSRKAPSRFTVFVLFPFDPAAAALDVDALGTVDGSVEEIDVNASDQDDARAIATAALEKDYEPGGRIVNVEERIGWYL